MTSKSICKIFLALCILGIFLDFLIYGWSFTGTKLPYVENVMNLIGPLVFLTYGSALFSFFSYLSDKKINPFFWGAIWVIPIKNAPRWMIIFVGTFMIFGLANILMTIPEGNHISSFSEEYRLASSLSSMFFALAFVIHYSQLTKLKNQPAKKITIGTIFFRALVILLLMLIAALVIFNDDIKERIQGPPIQRIIVPAQSQIR